MPWGGLRSRSPVAPIRCVWSWGGGGVCTSSREPAHTPPLQAATGRAVAASKQGLSEGLDFGHPGVPRGLLVLDTVEDSRDRVLECVVVLEVARVLIGGDRHGLGTGAEDLA